MEEEERPPVVSVCESKAVKKTEAIEWRIDQWSSLPDEHVTDGDDEQLGRTDSETMQAVGDKWGIQVIPGGFTFSMPGDTAEEVSGG